ncbi:TPA: DUF2574 family protein [Citrobacter freundii]
MIKSLSLGIIALVYGITFSAFASDTATLTIRGSVVAPTCSSEIINNQLQQRCGNVTHVAKTSDAAMRNPVKGAVTQVIALPGDATRKIVMTRYD